MKARQATALAAMQTAQRLYFEAQLDAHRAPDRAIEKYDEAVKLADRLLKIAPDNADARDLLAMSLFHQQDYTRAINEFRQFADVKSYRIKAIQYQVQAYYELEQYLDASALIEEVLDEEPAEVETVPDLHPAKP